MPVRLTRRLTPAGSPGSLDRSGEPPGVSGRVTSHIAETPAKRCETGPAKPAHPYFGRATRQEPGHSDPSKRRTACARDVAHTSYSHNFHRAVEKPCSVAGWSFRLWRYCGWPCSFPFRVVSTDRCPTPERIARVVFSRSPSSPYLHHPGPRWPGRCGFPGAIAGRQPFRVFVPILAPGCTHRFAPRSGKPRGRRVGWSGSAG